MNSPTPASTPPATPTEVFQAGRRIDVKLLDGSILAVFVRMMPARHLLEVLDLYDVGKETALIARCVTTLVDDKRAPITDDQIDLLEDESHVALLKAIHELNFKRAVSCGDRQIANGTELIPMKKRLAETMIDPVKQLTESWMSSLTQRVTAASPANKP